MSPDAAQGGWPAPCSSQVLKDRVLDSAIAEAQAIVNVLCFALAALSPPPASKIIAQTDCLSAIWALTGKLRKLNPWHDMR